MLFKSTTEFREYENVAATLEFADIKPSIRQVELNVLIPVLSQAEYDSLNNAYTAAASVNDLNADQKALLEYCRFVVAPLALVLWSFGGQLSKSSQGIQIVSTETHKQAFQWQVIEDRQALRLRGYQSVDRLLLFLENKKLVYTDWAGSDAYTVFKENFIQTAADYTNYYNIKGSRYLFYLIKPFINQVENGIVKNTILEKLYNTLKTKVKDGGLTTAEKKLIELLKPAVAGLSLAKAINQLTLQVTENGITLSSNQDTTTSNNYDPADTKRLADLKAQAEEDGNSALDVAYKYLLKNLSSFPDHSADPDYSPDGSPEIKHMTSPNNTTAFL